MKKLKSVISKVKKLKPGTGRRRRKIRQLSYNFSRLPGLLAIFSILLILGVFVTNRWIGSAIERLVPSQAPVAQFEPKVTQHELTPDDPQKYQMQKIKAGDLSLTQQDWNSRASQVSQSASPALKTKQDEKELQRRIHSLDRQIKNSEKLSRRNPSDYTIKENLQTLYMLRATLNKY